MRLCNGGGDFSTIHTSYTKSQCADHLAEAVRRTTLRKLQEEEEKRHHIANAEPLHCTYCGAKVGYVYECDMNGNYIICQECYDSTRRA